MIWKSLYLAGAALLLPLFATESLADYPIRQVSLGNTGQASLKAEDSGLLISVAYPMEEISGVCALDIVGDSYYRHTPIANLLEEVELLDFSGRAPANHEVISNTILRIPLSPSFLDGIRVRTKQGQSLRSAVEKALGANRSVVVVPRSCL